MFSRLPQIALDFHKALLGRFVVTAGIIIWKKYWIQMFFRNFFSLSNLRVTVLILLTVGYHKSPTVNGKLAGRFVGTQCNTVTV
jgi:hypothetical protein